MQHIIQTIFLALLQGVTELFPISSLGHTVLLPELFGWGNLVEDPTFLPIVVALHLGTSIALIIYFWKDWVNVIKGVIKTAQTRNVRPGSEEWVTWLIVIGSLPTGIIGLVLAKKIEALFTSPALIAAVLVLNGSVLFLGEMMRRRYEARIRILSAQEQAAQFRPLKSLTWKEGLIVGLAQSLALIPGFSRSGTTMVAGLGVRLTHEDSARYSFLLGTPAILAAGALEVPKLLHQNVFPLWLILVGIIISGVAAFLSTRFLTKYFEKGRLDPFAYYCWGFGILCIIIFLIHP